MIIPILKKVRHLCLAYIELGFKPVHLYRYTHLYLTKQIAVKEYINYSPYFANKEFLSSFLSYGEAQIFWTLLNPDKYSAIARDKYLSHLLLESKGIPMPELYAYYNPELSDTSGIRCANNFETLRSLLESIKVVSCVVKPAADGAHGIGVFIVKSILYLEDDCILVLSDNNELSLRAFCEKYICQPFFLSKRSFRPIKYRR